MCINFANEIIIVQWEGSLFPISYKILHSLNKLFLVKSITKCFSLFALAAMLLSSCATHYTEVTIWGVPEYEKVTIITSAMTYKDVSMPIKVKLSPKNLDGQKIRVICSKGEFPSIEVKLEDPKYVPMPIGGGFIGGAMVGLATGMANFPSLTNSTFYVDPSYFDLEAPDSIRTVDQKRMDIDALFEPQKNR
jgi:hypothetical protein